MALSKNDEETLNHLTTDIEEWTNDLAGYIADGDKRSARDAKEMIRDAKAEIEVLYGADPDTVDCSPANEGIHGTDRRYTFAL